MIIGYWSTPPKTNMEPENAPFRKGETSTNHQFWGSMLIFSGKSLFRFGKTRFPVRMPEVLPECRCLLDADATPEDKHGT